MSPPVRVLLSLILLFLSLVKTAPPIPRTPFNATDLIPRADTPESQSSESSPPSQNDEPGNPRPTPMTDERYDALVEKGKLMFAYLDGDFDLPPSHIQGPEADDNVRDWYAKNKMALQSQGWVPAEPSETKADILGRVCLRTLRGTKIRPNHLPIIDRWTSLSWEKQGSDARYSHMIELSELGYDRDLLIKNVVVYEMKGLPESTYPATDLGYFDWEYYLRLTPVDPESYGVAPSTIIFANVFDTDAESLALRLSPPFGTGDWPGIHYPFEFSQSNRRTPNKYFALLGTSFGQYATYFLRTHRSLFGNRRIFRIHLITPADLPTAWDPKLDGTYPHVFVFRISPPIGGGNRQHDPAGGESSAQAAEGGPQHDEDGSPP